MENKECVKKDYKNECGICPVCKEISLHYHNVPTMDGGNLYYTYYCENCGCEGEEVYYVEFLGHKFYDRTEEETEYIDLTEGDF